jgi:hypothetical protein
MKTLLLRSLIVLPCLLAGPALADPSPPPPAAADHAVPPPASPTSADTTGRKDYQREADAQMHDWRAKLQSLEQKTAEKSEKISVAAKKDLRIAWRDAKVQSRRLQEASAEGWENAKVAFATASEHLREAWNRADPDKKQAQ